MRQRRIEYVIVLTTLIVLLNGACGGNGTGSGGGATTNFEEVRDSGTVRFGYANEPPFAFEEGGDIVGSDVEIMKAALEPLGITDFEPVLVKFEGLIPGLAARRFDVVPAGLGIRRSRCEEVAFGNVNLIIGDTFIVQNGNPKDLHSWQDILEKDAVLGVFAGTSEQAKAKQVGIEGDQLLVLPDPTSVIGALEAGRVDAFAELSISARELIKDREDLEIATPFTDLQDEDGNPIVYYTGLAFNKEDTDFVDAYNAELKKLIESGEIERILTKHGFGPESMPTSDLTADYACQFEFD